MNNVEETIKNLRPGDRVRVTYEQDVKTVDDGVIYFEKGPAALVLSDSTITSIEVIERPLQVGDRVSHVNRRGLGKITGMDEDYAIVALDGRADKYAFRLSDLRRVS